MPSPVLAFNGAESLGGVAVLAGALLVLALFALFDAVASRVRERYAQEHRLRRTREALRRASQKSVAPRQQDR